MRFCFLRQIAISDFGELRMSHKNKDYIAMLRSKGYRVTAQRLMVLDAVCEIKAHATIAEIQNKVHFFDPSIDRSTIYRALEVLTQVGLVTETDLGHGKVYVIAGEAKHHHLQCKTCGKVFSIPEQALQNFIQEVQDNYGFQILADHLVLTGTCQDCQLEETKND
jgi:Fur family ferric uptake transcriptional regulator